MNIKNLDQLINEPLEVPKMEGLKAEPEVVDQAFVDRVKSAGLEIHVWTVNETETALRMRSIGIDSITTDCPAVIIKAFDQ